MAKVTTTHPKKISRSGSSEKRSTASGRFVIGRSSFTKISAVEGVFLSKRMSSDFARTEGMSASKRRSTLASKYGKK